jgi:hypothetical protein
MFAAVLLTMCFWFPPFVSGHATLANGWQTIAVGSPALPGSATYAACVQPAVSGCASFSVDASGVDIWGSSDQFRFVYQRLTGDVVVIARVASIDNVNAWSKAGVMIRESLEPGARHAFALASAGKGVAFQRRRFMNGWSEHTPGGAGAAPTWLKLERRASVVNAYRSDDGASWRLIGSDTVGFHESVYVGVAVTSHDPTALTSASIGSVIAAPLPPAVWHSSDVGSEVLPGLARYSAGTFIVDGAGADIWDTSDHFRFTYQRVAGDVDLVAHVSSVANVNQWAKAGLMLRESLAPEAAHASVFMTPAKGVAFQRRLSAALPTVSTSGGADSVPGWVKLERRGAVITSLFSADGSLWRVVGAEILPLPFTLYAGLAVTSHDASAYTQARFDSVRVATASGGAPTGSGSESGASTVQARFTPSADHDLLVSYYMLRIFDAVADVSTAAPITATSMGKPAVVNGECAVDITAIVESLASGQYIAVVSAVGAGGAASSAPSPVFTF